LKKLASILIVFGLLLSMGVQAADLKIGYVDNVRLFTEAPQAQAAQQRIMDQFKPLEQKLLAKQKNIQMQDERLQRDGAIMSPSERENLQRELKKAVRELQLEDAQLKEDFAAAQRKEQGALRETLMSAIQELAKAEGYDLVLYEGAAYVEPSLDITSKVLKSLANQ